MQNSVISTWFTSLYGSQPSSVVFACKTATFGPVYESLWVPDLTCRFVHAKQRDLHQNIKLTWVPASICCFVHAKQRLLEQNYKCVWVPDLICGFSTHNSVLSTRIKRQYGFQPSPVVLCMQTATLALELLISIVPCPHLRFLHANQRLLEQNYKSVWDPDHTCRFVHARQRDYHLNY